MIGRWSRVRIKGIFRAGWGYERKGSIGFVSEVSDDGLRVSVRFSDGEAEWGDIYGVEIAPYEDEV